MAYHSLLRRLKYCSCRRSLLTTLLVVSFYLLTLSRLVTYDVITATNQITRITNFAPSSPLRATHVDDEIIEMDDKESLENIMRSSIERRSVLWSVNDSLILREYREVRIESCSTLRRPNSSAIRHRNEFWQVQSTVGDNEIVVYSAFYDDRRLVGSPVIRINAVSTDALSLQQLYCYLWYDGHQHPALVDASHIKVGVGHKVRMTVKYDQLLVTCRLPVSSPVPSHISVSRTKCAVSTILLPVTVPVRSSPHSSTGLAPWKHEFSICVETSFGSFQPEHIIEWIEANRMFGVTLFNIYNGNIVDDVTLKVLNYYARRGIVRLTPLPPSVDDVTVEGVKLSSPTSFNDCLMHNMYTSRFVVAIDYDELIVPRLDRDYHSMMSRIEGQLGTESYHTYSFRNAYFFTYFKPDDTQPAFLRSVRYRQRAKPDNYMFAMKSFVDPRRCLALFNHFCLLRLPGADVARYDTSVDVDTTIALSHHYRYRCPPELGEVRCNNYTRSRQRDDVMMTYKLELEARVRQTLADNGLTYL